MVIACRAATVTAPWRAWLAVAVMWSTSWSKDRPGSWTATAARPCTCAWLGITATRTSPDSSAVRAAISAVRTESWSLGSTTTSAAPQPSIASSSMPVLGRWPGPPGTTTAPASRKSAGEPGAGGDRDDLPALAGGVLLAGSGDLLGEVGDPPPGVAARPRSRPRARRRRRRRARGRSRVRDRRRPPASRRGRPGRGAARRSGRRRRRGGTSPRRPGRPGSGRWPAAAPGSGGRPGRSPGASCRRPVSAVSAASRITLSPRPPASTTPASARTCELLGGVGQRDRGPPLPPR